MSDVKVKKSRTVREEREPQCIGNEFQVRYRCVIELFVALFELSICTFDISAGVVAFVKGLSRNSSFFSQSVCL